MICLNPKKYLEQIRWLDIKINDKIWERDSYWSLATKITPTLSQAPRGTGTSDKVGNIVAKIVDIDAEINRQIDEFIDLKNKIIEQIEVMPDEKHRTLLYKKYVEYKDLSVVACEMHYEYKSILNMHGYALKAFKKLMEQNDIQM